MSKLLVMVVCTVLLLGAALFTFGGKIIPATETAGNTTVSTISDAFQ